MFVLVGMKQKTVIYRAVICWRLFKVHVIQANTEGLFTVFAVQVFCELYWKLICVPA